MCCREVPRHGVSLRRASWVDAPKAAIGVLDDEVEAWETASVRILGTLYGSGTESYNARAHEFHRLRMQGEIVLPREACGDCARLCSASVILVANQLVQFSPG